MSTGNTLLNHVFTRNTFKKLIESNLEKTYITAVQRYVIDPENKDNQQLISEIYRELQSNYRNEYFYKNTLLNKLLLGVHSLRTTTALTEVPVGKSKADLILINGKAVVYEIKTELDNLDRLESQISDYFKAFNHVSIVTCESNYKAIEKRLMDAPVGIILLTNSDRLSIKRKAIENNSYLDLSIMFKILRKMEYQNIIKNYYGELPSVSQFNYYSTCHEMFCAIEPSTAYNLFLKELKKRNRINIALYSNVPYELKSLIYFSNLKDSDYLNLQGFLVSKFGG